MLTTASTGSCVERILAIWRFQSPLPSACLSPGGILTSFALLEYSPKYGLTVGARRAAPRIKRLRAQRGTKNAKGCGNWRRRAKAYRRMAES